MIAWYTHTVRGGIMKKNIITDMQCDGMDGEHI